MDRVMDKNPCCQDCGAHLGEKRCRGCGASLVREAAFPIIDTMLDAAAFCEFSRMEPLSITVTREGLTEIELTPTDFLKAMAEAVERTSGMNVEPGAVSTERRGGIAYVTFTTMKHTKLVAVADNDQRDPDPSGAPMQPRS